MRRLTTHELAILCRELGFELFHRSIPRWRLLSEIGEELLADAACAARNKITRRLMRVLPRVA